MTFALATHHLKAPYIGYASLSFFIALGAGAFVVLLAGLLRSRFVRRQIVPVLSLITLGGALGLEIWRLPHAQSIVAGALRIDGLSVLLDMLFTVAAIVTVLLSWRALAPREAGQGEFHSLLLFSVLGMVVFVSAQNLITLFLGIELLSIPLYILCATEMRREGSLESGLKYLIVGSVGSATLVYGFAMIYGATGATQYSAIASAASVGKLAGGVLGDPMLFTGIALAVVGFAFKASVAPFHQWTPDVYEGAPTPVTAFMATATKAAALGAILRFFDVAVIGAQNTWGPLLATVAAVTIIVGNVGALGQSSLKRLLGYSGVAQAGYMLAGVIVGTQLGVGATVIYLGFYLLMNMAAFGVIAARERDTPLGDDISALAGLGARNPWLAWPMTIGMLALAGIPGTVGFIGKFQLIRALVEGDYTWLAIVLVVGSMISLAYYLRVVAAIWMRGEPAAAPGPRRLGATLAPIAGGSPEADEEASSGGASGSGRPESAGAPGSATGGASVPAGPEQQGAAAAEPVAELALTQQARTGPEVVFVAVLAAAACVAFGVFPSPVFHLAGHAVHALAGLVSG